MIKVGLDIGAKGRVMARIGFLGTGEIAAALVRGLAGQGHEIVVSPRNHHVSDRLALEIAGLRVASGNDEVVAASDVVFLCLLAPTARQILADLPFRVGQSIISVMVDMPMADLTRLCAPAGDIAITIPLPFVASGGCPLPVFPDSAALQRLYGATNKVFAVHSEAALNAHFAATALCSPLLEQMQATAQWLAGITGDPGASEGYVRAVIRGYLPEAATTGHLTTMLDALSTDGGLNSSLRTKMQPVLKNLTEGLDGFRPRLGLPDAE